MQTTATIIDYLSILVLVGFAVALGFLIALIYRANRLLSKLDHIGDSFKVFVEDVAPAIINIGSVTKAVHSVLSYLAEKHKK
jgi:hypothetical protein